MEMRLRLYFEELGRIPMPFPPVFEQNQIVQTIENLECKYDEIINKAGDQIRLLQERRTALISAAVTGKIDIRDWRAPAGSTVYSAQKAQSSVCEGEMELYDNGEEASDD